MHDVLGRHVVGLHELRRHLGKLLDRLAHEGEEVVITRQGKPTAVIVEVEKYLEVQEAFKEISDPEYLANLLKARREVRKGDAIGVEICADRLSLYARQLSEDVREHRRKE